MNYKKRFWKNCDTFVALGNSTESKNVIFGKNSDRPQSESQLITYIPRTKYDKGAELKGTYISIPQVTETAAVLLSQPYWMYGAEMGVNEYNVAIGNEAVFTKEPLRDTGLLGMDLLRLGLERGKSAREALEIITNLLEKYGQGGGCAVNSQGWSYHNSFIIADSKEAYILETADMWWVVEIVKDVRSISNNLSIRGKGDFRRDGIIQYSVEKGYCRDDNEFNFANIFSSEPIPEKFPPTCRDGRSLQLLAENKGKITPVLMMEFLREHQVGLCMHRGTPSVGSQVSLLRAPLKTSIHWFTGSSIPCLSIFKPYIFPADGTKFMKPGPYDNVNPKWFWNKHADFIKPFKNRFNKVEYQEFVRKSREIEISLVNEVYRVLENENKLSKAEILNKIRTLNLKAWDKSEEIIK
jgi:secernin